MVVTGSNPKNDPSSDPKAATNTNNRKFTQKLLISRFVPKIIPVVIIPINPLVTADAVGVQYILSLLQTVLPKQSVMEAAHSCARISGGLLGR